MLAALKVLLAVALVGAGLPSGPQTRTGGSNPVPQAFTGASAAISPGSAWEIYDSAPELAADALLAAKDGTAPQRVEHAEPRAAEARAGDAHRQVGDPKRVLRDWRVFRDTDTGNAVHVNGDRVVITSPDGARVITQFTNTRANTQARIQSGRWEPVGGNE